MRKILSLSLVPGVMFLLAGPAATVVRADGEPSSLKIGTVDVTKVFAEYEKSRDGRVTLEKHRSEMQDGLDKREKALKKIEQELEVLEAEEKLKKKAEFDEKRKEYTAYYTVNNKELQRKQSELWKDAYNEIGREIRGFGEKNDYDLILKADNDPISGKGLDDIQLRVDIKKVLYHSPRIDLTDEIINILNEKYKRTKESKEKNR